MTKGQVMKKTVLVFIVVLLAGCSGGSGISSLFSPSREESRVPVVYPAEYQQSDRAEGSSMVQTYGATWENVSGEYPEYRFN